MSKKDKKKKGGKPPSKRDEERRRPFSRDECLSGMASVVATLSCFAGFLTESGTCAEAAARLQAQLQADTAARKVARAAANLRRAEELRKRRAERHSEGDIDLEDSDVELPDDTAAEQDADADDWDAGTHLLGCVSLSKMVTDYVDEQQSKGAGCNKWAVAIMNAVTRKGAKQARQVFFTQVRAPPPRARRGGSHRVQDVCQTL